MMWKGWWTLQWESLKKQIWEEQFSPSPNWRMDQWLRRISHQRVCVWTEIEPIQMQIQVKIWYSFIYKHELWLCDSCCSAIKTQSPLLFCPAYSTLRDWKDLHKDDYRLYPEGYEYKYKVEPEKINSKVATGSACAGSFPVLVEVNPGA